MSHDNDAVNFLISLLNIPSPSGNEAQIAEYLRAFLEANHFQIVNSNVGNVIGIRGSGPPVIMLASHMDTVQTKNPFRQDKNKIFATGTVDCKSALASLFYAAAATPWPDGFGTLILAGIVHEEDATFGMEEILNMGFHPECAIFGEPTRDDRICIGYRGRVVVKIKVNAESGHASIPWDYDNPLEILNSIYNQLTTKANQFNASIKKTNGDATTEAHFQELSVTLTEMQGGVEANTIPAIGLATLDVRLPIGVTVKQLQTWVDDIIQERLKSKKRTSTMVTVDFESNFEACEISSSAQMIAAVKWAISQAANKKAVLIKKTGSSFTNIIQQYYGKENPQFVCLTYGPGDSHLEHTDGEFIEIEEYLECIEILKKALPKYVSLKRMKS